MNKYVILGVVIVVSQVAALGWWSGNGCAHTASDASCRFAQSISLIHLKGDK